MDETYVLIATSDGPQASQDQLNELARDGYRLVGYSSTTFLGNLWHSAVLEKVNQ